MLEHDLVQQLVRPIYEILRLGFSMLRIHVVMVLNTGHSQ